MTSSLPGQRRRIDLGDPAQGNGLRIARTGYKCPLTFVEYQPDTTPSLATLRLTCRGERFRIMYLHSLFVSKARKELSILGTIKFAPGRSAFTVEPGKVRKDSRDEVAVMRIGRRQASRV